ncbi:uncharacterized protein LOC18421929 [Amborella trichopoda]|uniref:Elongin-A n=1 Tax=Amborella trichopoda TaxID=13333 RepID=W1NGZ5_AMBTC|nr:uncharacterized protein LOC18421929 [Amborella trichopoda]XP_020518909.1 uncharacterized protein LOC18421929 [Amborella trichopoda]XP_020518913.1 uncharacterized protein LOC18421929 [Amborella trichopoda]ERM94440.1 hypothetical protein AMTR_s00010p00258630 [Amborella trichopoda]|eukprot:XP_006827203.1 uncharacterized protein LOC18421929 [Amborella trichopoda]
MVKVPSLLDLCIQNAIDNIKYLGDVGETDLNILKLILTHCTADQLMHIEKCSEGRDLSPVTDSLWKTFYEQHFGTESANIVIKRMKQKGRYFKWKLLYQAKLKERDEAQKKSVDRMKQLYAEESNRKQSRQIQLCSKVPPASKKRSFCGGSGSCNSLSNVKGNLMKKARMEYLNSHEVKMHTVMRRQATQRSSTSSFLRSTKTSGFMGSGSSTSNSKVPKLPRRA